jgi:sodium-dependent dicarboxylate transporter 2/3/5
MFNRNFKILLGLALFAGMLILPAPAGMSDTAWRTAAVMVLLAAWWATEALPIPVTSLLPLLLFPALGVFDIGTAAAPYAHKVIFLLLGGFVLATALAKWGLHRRIALAILVKVGDHPAAIVAGFMGVTAFLSMWISNTATSIMMLPIALSVAGEVLKGLENDKKSSGFMICLLLGIAYSASIGGLGTPIGTPPNVLVIAALEKLNIDVSFLSWMMFGIPVVCVLVPVAWFVLTRWAYPFEVPSSDVQKLLQSELEKMGAMSSPEKRVAMVFLFVAASWVLRVPIQQNLEIFPWLTDHMIAVGGAVLMFMVPSGCKTEKGTALLDWETANKIPWGVLLLFGGGLSLAAAVKSSGLAVWLGSVLIGITALPLIVMILILVTFVIFLTELTSNTATTATLLPILGSLAIAAGIEPMLFFAPAALAASCAFMLPVATGPNAVIFASGKITIPQMAHAGFKLNLLAIAVITVLSYYLLPMIFMA